jgi:hypothetical protein
MPPTPTPTPRANSYTFQDPGACNCGYPVSCTPCNLPTGTAEPTCTVSWSGGSATLTWDAGAGAWKSSLTFAQTCTFGSVVYHWTEIVFGCNLLSASGLSIECGFFYQLGVGLACYGTNSGGNISSYTCSPFSVTFTMPSPPPVADCYYYSICLPTVLTVTFP